MTFVVDVSGSMGGVSIEQAKSALRLCLRHLAEGDRFQVIAFSTTFHLFEPRLVPFTQRTLESADRWVQSLQAHGGTEMLQPLQAALAGFDDAKRDRVIVLLTDGQVATRPRSWSASPEAPPVRGSTASARHRAQRLLLSVLARRTAARGDGPPRRAHDDKCPAQFARATAPRMRR